jgi:hypothetical protein
MTQDDALHQAFSLVLSTASPEVARRALRAGLIALLAEEPRRPRAPVPAKNTARRAGWPKGRKRGPRAKAVEPDTLSAADRERLDFLVQSGRAADTGIRTEVLQRAIDGATLEPAIASKLKVFMTG